MVWMVKLLLFNLLWATVALANILDEIARDPNLQQFVSEAKKYRLIETYADLENFPLTIFVPNNAAIGRAIAGHKKLDPMYHVASSLVNKNSPPDTVATILPGGIPLYFTKYKGDLYVNNAKVMREGRVSSKKYFAIDEVIDSYSQGSSSGQVPTALSFLQDPKSVYNLDYELGKFVSKIKANNLDQWFNDPNKKHTFFIPENFPGDPRTDAKYYERILKGHIIPGKVLFLRTMNSEQEYDSALNEPNLEVSISLVKDEKEGKGHGNQNYFIKSHTVAKDDTSYSNGAVISPIVRANIPVGNGVVHIIKKPLMIVDTPVKEIIESQKDGRLQEFYSFASRDTEFMRNFNNMKHKIIFAPANEAFTDAMDEKQRQNIKNDPAKLRKLLNLHFAFIDKNDYINILYKMNGSLKRACLDNDRMLIIRVVGHNTSKVDLTVEGGGVNATAIQADVVGTDGIVNIINKVLGNPFQTIYQKLSEDPELEFTYKISQAKNWGETLNNIRKNYTFFAPNNEAWEKFRTEYPSEYKQLKMDQYAYHAEKIMNRHLVVGHAYHAKDLRKEEDITTARGNFKIISDGGEDFVMWENKKGKIERKDVMATNGVIHVIDTVMLLRRDLTQGASQVSFSFTLLLLAVLAVIQRTVSWTM